MVSAINSSLPGCNAKAKTYHSGQLAPRENNLLYGTHLHLWDATGGDGGRLIPIPFFKIAIF